MGDAQNAVWVFLKNFSNKFSISDLMNGNDKRSSNTNGRKHISYNQLETHDKGDFLSSSNPNLLDIVGKSSDEPNTSTFTSGGNLPTQKSPSGLSLPPPLPQTTTLGLGSGITKMSTQHKKGTKEEAYLTTKKFTFPKRVPSYLEDETKTRGECCGGNENFQNDSNWIEYGEDEDDDNDDERDEDDESDFEDEGESRRRKRCGFCGCEKKYVGTSTTQF